MKFEAILALSVGLAMDAAAVRIGNADRNPAKIAAETQGACLCRVAAQDERGAIAEHIQVEPIDNRRSGENGVVKGTPGSLCRGCSATGTRQQSR